MTEASGSPISILIDSNIFIAAEDHGTTGHAYGSAASELMRLAQKLGYSLAISHGTHADVLRAPPELRAERRRQLEKYNVLDEVPLSSRAQITGQFPTILDANTRADLEVLSTFLTGAADWLVTNDAKLRTRAGRCADPSKVMSLDDALDALRPLFSAGTSLPAVTEVAAYTIPQDAPIFDSLRASYPGFDTWWTTKVARDQRRALILGDRSSPEGLAVLKPEDEQAHGLRGKVMKMCTFKVSDDYQGTKRGELLLKAVIEHARGIGRDEVYVEVLPESAHLLEWLAEFGFNPLLGATTRLGEVVLAKQLVPDPMAAPLDPLIHNIAFGPGSVNPQAAHVVPVQARWHSRLLPETEDQGDMLAGTWPCGNAIRKAYLCRSNTTHVAPGDLLLFLRTGSGVSEITSVGVVESTLRSASPHDVVRFVSARSVYSYASIQDWCAGKRPVLAVRFRLDRVLAPGWAASTVRSNKVMTASPQSIAGVPEEGMAWVRSQLAE